VSRGVLVTGASRGVGRAVAVAFAGRGDRVAVHYASRASDAEETVARLPGAGHVLVGGDLADPGQAEAVVATAIESLDGVDVVVNNAAAAIRHPLPSTSYADWQQAWQHIVGVNLFGAANVTYCAARHMIDTGREIGRAHV
jgi:3-oxoacyl-[acyl-carrier protein] reductase